LEPPPSLNNRPLGNIVRSRRQCDAHIGGECRFERDGLPYRDRGHRGKLIADFIGSAHLSGRKDKRLDR